MTERARYLQAHHFDLVRVWWAEYRIALDRVGFPSPWAFALAGAHYQESNLQADAKGEPGGPFCIDVPGHGKGEREAVRTYALEIFTKYGHRPVDPYLEKHFPDACLVAAAHLLRKLKPPRPGLREIVLRPGSYPDLRADMMLALARWNGFPPYYNELWQTGVPGSSTAPKVAWHPYVSNDPLNGLQLYREGTIEQDDGGTLALPKAPYENPGAIVVADELHARWDEWYPGPRSPAAATA